VSTEIEGTAATAAPPQKFTAPSRIFHWLTAILIFAALFIGFTMVNWLAGYAELRVIHMSIGALILLVVILRIVNRARHHPPAWPPTVGRLEGKAVIWTERALYFLLLAQPLVGWAMVSASGTPVRVFGVLRQPPIAPSTSTCSPYCAKHIRSWRTCWSSSSRRMCPAYWRTPSCLATACCAE
jgi:cytochrome b561